MGETVEATDLFRGWPSYPSTAAGSRSRQTVAAYSWMLSRQGRFAKCVGGYVWLTLRVDVLA